MGVHDLGLEFVTIVDDIDDDLFEGVRWRTLHSESKTPYVIKSSKTGGILLHRVILERVLGRELERGEYVDHVNGDGLDNRRENLRLATSSQT